MKKIFKTTFLIASSILVTSTVTPLVSCNSKPEPEKKGLQIFEPLQKTINTKIEDARAVMWFNGFQYDHDKSMIFDINKLEVKIHIETETFILCDAMIDRQDILNKTFSVKISYSEAGGDDISSISCTFEFLYDGKPVEDFVSSKYTINFFHTALIYMPEQEQRYVDTRLDASGNGTIVYEGFSFDPESEIEDISAFAVNNTFSQASGTSFVSTIEDFNKTDKTFKVKIEITGALPVDLLPGQLSFKYGDIDVPVDKKEISFEMRLKDIIDITKPTGELATAEGFVDDNHNATLLFERFECSGIDDPEKEIEIENEGFEQIAEEKGWEITYKPVNWSLTSKSFDIQVDITGVQDVKDFDCLKGDFTFKVNHEDLPTEASEFTGVVKYSIPEDKFTFGDEAGQKVLTGIAEGTDLTNYNAVSIPTYVSIIGDKAFYNDSETKSKLTPNIKYLNFPKNSALEVIRNQAFAMAPFEQKNISFPQALSSILSNAFDGCAKLTGCISFPYVSFDDNPISIGAQVFNNCSGIEEVIISQPVSLDGEKVFAGCENLKVIDFSHTYQWDLIPSWLKESTNAIFQDVGSKVCTVENKGQVILNTKTPQNLVQQWITQLNKAKLDITNDPQTSKWECKIMPE